MGSDIFSATVENATNNLYLLVLDGNKWGRFIVIPPGTVSSDYVASVDAFAAFIEGVFQPVISGGRSSYWWKVPDGVSCTVHNSYARSCTYPDHRITTLEVHFYLPKVMGKGGPPSATKYTDWGYRAGMKVEWNQ